MVLGLSSPFGCTMSMLDGLGVPVHVLVYTDLANLISPKCIHT
jgi:hypothetical protein